MVKISIPHNTFVFVGDGRKALFLRNEGDEKFLNLKTEQVLRDQNPPTREQGSDQPGRAFASVGARRSAVGATDWHEIEEHRFADVVADALQQIVRERQVRALIVVAAPRTLAKLRRAFHPEVMSCIVAEIDKDLTNEPVYEIERHFTDLTARRASPVGLVDHRRAGRGRA